jgi:hypothetical protein
MSGDINVQTFSGKVNISNNLKVGSGHLFVDTLNNQVGLNTNDPKANLHVNGNTYVHTNFRVGSGIVMNETSGRITAGSFVGDGSGLDNLNTDSGSWVNGTDVVYLSTIGDKVGIGVNPPLHKLDVDGDINFTGALKINGTAAVFSNWTVSGSDISRSSGNVGIGGAASATNKLKVHGTVEATRFAGSGSNGGTLEILTMDVGRGDVYFENNSNDNDSGNGITLRTPTNPGSTGSIFAVRSSGHGCRLWVGQDVTAVPCDSDFCAGQDGYAVGSENDRSTYNFIVKANGDVGIGTTTPEAQLHIGPKDNDHIYLASSSNDYGWKIDTDDQGAGDVPFRIIKRTNDVDTTILTIKNQDGNVGIGGTASTTNKLKVTGTVEATIGFTGIQTSDVPELAAGKITSGTFHVDRIPTLSAYAALAGSTTQAFSVSTLTTTGDVGIGTTSPATNLNIQGDSGGVPPTTGGEGTSNGIFRVRDNYNVALDIGTKGSSPWTTWLQVADATSMGTEYPLSLQPNGGNVGIGTDSPEGGLHIYGKTLILGQVASVPSGPDGTMYYNSTTNQPLVKVNGSWISLVNFLPSNISGLVGWYLPENWTGSRWTDASTAGKHVTAYEGTINYTASHSGSSVGASATFPVIYGNTSAELNFPSGILPSTYTLISMTRYNGSTKQRILDGQNGNWLSGHWSGSSGVAYHNGWLTNQTNRHGSNWVIGVDQNSLYRSKSQSVAWTNDTGGGGASMRMRLGSVGYEASEWMCAELIVYNRTLSSDEYTQLADYIQNKYGIY